MKETDNIMRVYSSEFYRLYSEMPLKEWGTRENAEKYLTKYWLPQEEYREQVRAMQAVVFNSSVIEFPDFVFRDPFELIALRGGVLFVEEEFHILQECLFEIGDSHFYIVENNPDNSFEEPQLRMKYPSNITWNELMNGNFISIVLFKWPIKEYYVFGSSGKWGKYAANDYEMPVDVYGFDNSHSQLFKRNFYRHKKRK